MNWYQMIFCSITSCYALSRVRASFCAVKYTFPVKCCFILTSSLICRRVVGQWCHGWVCDERSVACVKLPHPSLSVLWQLRRKITACSYLIKDLHPYLLPRHRMSIIKNITFMLWMLLYSSRSPPTAIYYNEMCTGCFVFLLIVMKIFPYLFSLLT